MKMRTVFQCPVGLHLYTQDGPYEHRPGKPVKVASRHCPAHPLVVAKKADKNATLLGDKGRGQQ